eukprot:GHVU01224582.1.p1 GENE.GHVU01224582.1~~GHVU01224582.1.p1  ORF type:complete len:1078 (+),score=119.63 GHVU01224582.1:223-3456(+)
MLWVNFGGARTRANVDCGCDRPLIGACTLAEVLGGGTLSRLRATEDEVTVANWANMQVLGKVEVPLVVGQQQPIEVDTIVVADDVPLYLDYSTMSRLDISVHPRRNGVITGDGSFLPFDRGERGGNGNSCHGIGVEEHEWVGAEDSESGQEELGVPNGGSGGAEVKAALEGRDPNSHRELDPQQQKQLSELMEEFQDVFEGLKVADVAPVEIKLRDNAPVRCPPRHYNATQSWEIREQVREMEKAGIISGSASPWCSQVLLVRKKDGKQRFCIDYRRVNKKIIPSSFPIPRIEEMVNLVGGNSWYIVLDLKSGFWQLPLDEASRKVTAFMADDKLFEFNRLPFGLSLAAQAFQQRIREAFGDMWRKGVGAYIDDILIYGKTFAQCLHRFRRVLERCRERRFTVKAEKLQLFPKKLHYLGFLVDETGYAPDPEKAEALQQVSAPRDKAGIRRILGLFGYYRRFIPEYAEVALCISDILKDTVAFRWGEEQDAALKSLKTALAQDVLNYHFDPSLPVVVDSDASGKAIGSALQQLDGEVFRPVAFASRKFADAELNWHTREKEAFAVVWALGKFRPYLVGRPFLVRTDHSGLQWLRDAKQPKLIRWCLAIAEFDCTIMYNKGKDMCHVDTLSRPEDPDVVETSLAEACSIGLHQVEVSAGGDGSEVYPDIAELVRSGAMMRCDEGYYYGNRRYAPPEEREAILVANHYSPWGGHPGVSRSLRRLSERYFWPSMRADVKALCASCMTCRRRAKTPKPSAQSGHLKKAEPFELVALDIVGPIRHWNRSFTLLSMVDHATRWAECVPIASMESAAVAREFVATWVSRYGVPKRVLTDRGSNFIATFNEECCHRLRMKRSLASPYHPQGNSIVERFHGTFKGTLTKLTVTYPTFPFHLLLALAMCSYRSTPHTAIGDSPFFALTGTDFRLPDFVIPPRALPAGTSERSGALQKVREEMFYMQLATAGGARPDKPKDEFAVGQLVLCRLTPHERRTRRHQVTGGQRPPVWSLPRRIVAVTGEGSQLTTRGLLTGKDAVISASDVCPFTVPDDSFLARSTMEDEVTNDGSSFRPGRTAGYRDEPE